MTGKPSNAREALLAELLGDVQELLARLEQADQSAKATAAAVTDATAQYRGQVDELVALAAACRHGRVALDAVQCARRGRETQVQVARLGAERAQHAHRHRGDSRHFVGQQGGRHQAAWYWIYSQ